MSEQRYITNLEYIKSRNTEEFAALFYKVGCPPDKNIYEKGCQASSNCKDCWLRWLREKGPEIG